VDVPQRFHSRKTQFIVEIRVKEVKSGFTLAIPRVDRSSPPRLFNVVAVGSCQMVGGMAMVQFTREVVTAGMRAVGG